MKGISKKFDLFLNYKNKKEQYIKRGERVDEYKKLCKEKEIGVCNTKSDERV